ncbi:hypothetical protein ACU3L3_07495 [Priestia endophytica]
MEFKINTKFGEGQTVYITKRQEEGVVKTVKVTTSVNNGGENREIRYLVNAGGKILSEWYDENQLEEAINVTTDDIHKDYKKGVNEFLLNAALLEAHRTQDFTYVKELYKEMNS